MRPPKLWSSLLVLFAAGALACQGQPGPALPPESEINEQLQKLQVELANARTSGIRAIKVNGKTLTPEHVRREALYLVGAKLVEAKISDFFIDEWKEKAIKDDKRDPKEFEFSEEAIVKELEANVREFQIKNPGTEFWEAVRAMTGLDREGYMQQRRATEVFNKVFFPGPADKWPQITREAIMASAAGGQGAEFWANLEKSARDEKTGAPRELPAFWLQLCRGWVQKQLKNWSDIRYPSDGLPGECALVVNGREWKTAEAFESVRSGLYYQDLERAMIELVVREALRQELDKHDSFLSDDDFRAAYKEYSQEYDNTPFTTEVIAVAFKGYPSLEAFRQRWRLMRSFENFIKKDINDDNLKAHAERYSRFFADGQTSVDFIPFLAKDSKTTAWVPGGFPAARKRAEAAFAEIQDGASFDEMLDKKGEFFPNDEAKGRLGMRSMNQIRQLMRENEFTDLVLGYSLGMHLFYDAPEGKIIGPLRGSDAYYIARVNARTPARQTMQITDSRTRELVKQDYVTQRFMQWANEVLRRTQID
jgi:hypothetical protein